MFTKERKNLSPHSNNSYKRAAPLGTILVTNKGDAFLMPQQINN